MTPPRVELQEHAAGELTRELWQTITRVAQIRQEIDEEQLYSRRLEEAACELHNAVDHLYNAVFDHGAMRWPLSEVPS